MNMEPDCWHVTFKRWQSIFSTVSPGGGKKPTGAERHSFRDSSSLWKEGGEGRAQQRDDSVVIRTESVMGWNCWSTGRRSKQAALLGGPHMQRLSCKRPKRLSKDERAGILRGYKIETVVIKETWWDFLEPVR